MKRKREKDVTEQDILKKQKISASSESRSESQSELFEELVELIQVKREEQALCLIERIDLETINSTDESGWSALH